MNRQVAFLRAINVGGRRVLKDQLCELFEALGFGDVATYRASGNVIFSAEAEASELEGRIEAHLEASLGYDVPTFVRTAEELEAILATSAFSEHADKPRHKRYVIFLERALSDEERRDLAEFDSGVDRFICEGREVHWLRDLDAGESISTGEIEQALGVAMTRRTLGTVERILKKCR